ncbi:Chromo domain/shadow [Plasmopara halstedii]|uniref:Chromo domain/shadow n=1 Tax=Plasmopara halstedii TaxID=4781 RepID=A0A0P1AY79_PLAHL|nr:Chromo domain/shadow [Plasmopara halstedii]CEG47418.1 Chromo domain/shadow [Plasmopara halstedii]|eukprot:XP_024583787.1 Chromo domain/shadow [Plasmopara halstedii]
MKGDKLMVRWVGLFRIIQELLTSFLIEHLLTKETFDVHVIRLKHYADDMLSVTEELKHHEWELLVGWHGLEDAEDSWESMGSIVKAVPDIVKAFVETQVLGEEWTDVQVSDLTTPYSG